MRLKSPLNAHVKYKNMRRIVEVKKEKKPEVK